MDELPYPKVDWNPAVAFSVQIGDSMTAALCSEASGRDHNALSLEKRSVHVWCVCRHCVHEKDPSKQLCCGQSACVSVERQADLVSALRVDDSVLTNETDLFEYNIPKTVSELTLQ